MHDSQSPVAPDESTFLHGKGFFQTIFIRQITPRKDPERSGALALASGPCSGDAGRLHYSRGAADGEQRR